MKKRIIICGSGNSMPFDNELDKKLSNILKNEYSIGLNLFFKYGCETTFNTWADWQFYRENIEVLEKLPLLIGKYDPSLFRLKLLKPNTICLPYSNKYLGKESWSPDFQLGMSTWTKGFYCPHLAGFFALTIAIALGFDEIYLLGYDCKEINGKTHFYQDIINLTQTRKCDNVLIHYGVGKKELIKEGKKKLVYTTGTYNEDILKFDRRWNVYKKELNKIKIINVSPDSRINAFPKISYEEFYKIFEQSNNIIQDKARQEMIEVINEKNKSI